VHAQACLNILQCILKVLFILTIHGLALTPNTLLIAL
jgi:hypothetical protein